MRAELAALISERDGKFYRPDGSEIPFKRFEPRKRSFVLAPAPANRNDASYTFDWLDADSGVGDYGRSRMKIFSSDLPAADGAFIVLPCRPAA
jgi:hypothetical protein